MYKKNCFTFQLLVIFIAIFHIFIPIGKVFATNQTSNKIESHYLPQSKIPTGLPEIPKDQTNQFAIQPIQAVIKTLPIQNIPSSEVSNNVNSDLVNIEKKPPLVNKLMDIDYKTQNPPEKLYNREITNSNKHLPPVYFKSYYLSLAFKAVEKDEVNNLRAVLDKFSFINGQNTQGDTILMAAVQNNSINCARVLIGKGAYLDATNQRKRTALHYAATLGNAPMAKLLLTSGADYSLGDDREMTALDYAIAQNKAELIQLIEDYDNNQITGN